MDVYGIESIRSELDSGGYVVKFLAREQAVVFFPRTAEHRDSGVMGLTYQDDSQGNALAGILSPGRIEIRYHNRFSDERVKEIAVKMTKHPDLAFARGFMVVYQGRVLFDAR